MTTLIESPGVQSPHTHWLKPWCVMFVKTSGRTVHTSTTEILDTVSGRYQKRQTLQVTPEPTWTMDGSPHGDDGEGTYFNGHMLGEGSRGRKTEDWRNHLMRLSVRRVQLSEELLLCGVIVCWGRGEGVWERELERGREGSSRNRHVGEADLSLSLSLSHTHTGTLMMYHPRRVRGP